MAMMLAAASRAKIRGINMSEIPKGKCLRPYSGQHTVPYLVRTNELRSQATVGLVSTAVRDHVGIRGAVGSLFLVFFESVPFYSRLAEGLAGLDTGAGSVMGPSCSYDKRRRCSRIPRQPRTGTRAADRALDATGRI